MTKINAKECQNVEFKRIWKDEYLKWICGFANAHGAVMYFGVDDDRKLCGLQNAKRLLEDIPNKISTTMGLAVDVDLHEQDGLDYIEMTIAPANVPISYKGKYYYRSGSTLQELTGTALTDFLMRKLNTTWDAATVPSATIDDIDPQAIQYFLNAAIREGRINKSARDESIEQLLHRLHLLSRENGQLTLAALLLFGKDVEQWNMTASFRIGRFGSSQSDLIIQDRIACPLIEMPDKVIETLRSKYLVSPIHYEGLYRKEPLEIPEEGLREMICNAVIHKDYTGTFIQMKVFDDHITLWNGGNLPPNYTVEKLMEQHESHPRNRLIANVFYLAGFIEAWGRGYEKIREAFEAEYLETPMFEEVRGGVMATIKRERFIELQNKDELENKTTTKTDPTTTKTTTKTTKKTTTKTTKKTTTKTTEKILNAIEKNPQVTNAQLAELCGLTKDGIYWNLRKLRLANIIRRVGPTNGGYWEIVLKD